MSVFDSEDELNPENYFDWVIDQSINNSPEDKTNLSNNIFPDVILSTKSSTTSNGIIVYFDSERNCGCIRKKGDVKNYFFSSNEIFSSDFTVRKGEEVLFTYDQSCEMEQKQKANNVICVAAERRVLVGEVSFVNKERGFGWIAINIFNDDKPYVFFLTQNFTSKENTDKVHEGSRVRFLVALENEQPYAEKLELIDESLYKCFINKLEWKNLLKNELPYQIFTGSVVGNSLLLGKLFMILPDNGAAVVWAYPKSIWTENQELETGERVKFLLNPKNLLRENGDRIAANIVLTERLHKGVVMNYIRSKRLIKIRWSEAAWYRPFFTVKNIKRDVKIGKKVGFYLIYDNGIVAVDSNIIYSLTKHMNKHIQRRNKIRSNNENEHNKKIETKPNEKVDDKDLEKILSQKIAEINLKAKRYRDEKTSIIDQTPFKNNQNNFNESRNIYQMNRNPQNFQDRIIPMNNTFIGFKNSNVIQNQGIYAHKNMQMNCMPPNIQMAPTNAFRRVNITSELGQDNIANHNQTYSHPNNAQYFKNMSEIQTKAKKRNLVKWKGKCVYYVANTKGKISGLNDDKSKVFNVGPSEVWSIDNNLFGGEEVSFYTEGYDSDNALLVQPVVAKRANLRGICTIVDKAIGEAAVQPNIPKSQLIFFAIPDVMKKSIKIGVPLLFNIGISELFEPYIINLQFDEFL